MGRIRFDIFLAWELDPIERFLDEAPAFFEKRADESGAPAAEWMSAEGTLTDAQIYLAARSLSLAAVIYHLNAVVDYALLALATRLLSPERKLTAQALSRSRTQLTRSIEQEYRVHVRFMPGWHQVEQLREDANALKHRGGSTLPEETPMGIPLFRQVEVTPEVLHERLAGAREWLVALWQATEGAKDKGEPA